MERNNAKKRDAVGAKLAPESFALDRGSISRAVWAAFSLTSEKIKWAKVLLNLSPVLFA